MKKTTLIAALALIFTACIPDSGHHRHRYYGIDDDDYEYEEVEEVETPEAEVVTDDVDELLDRLESALNRLNRGLDRGEPYENLSTTVDLFNNLMEQVNELYRNDVMSSSQESRYNRLVERIDTFAERFNTYYGLDDSAPAAYADSTAYYY